MRALIVAAALGLGCGGSQHPTEHRRAPEPDEPEYQEAEGALDAEHPESSLSGATCPEGGSRLTWDNFGHSFLDQYCTRCHSSRKRGSARNGATEGFDYDTVEGVRAHKAAIDEMAGAGDLAVNYEMPPRNSGAAPSEEDRRSLGEWLACGAP